MYTKCGITMGLQEAGCTVAKSMFTVLGGYSCHRASRGTNVESFSVAPRVLEVAKMLRICSPIPRSPLLTVWRCST